ncbi:MAG: hypothetical protein HY740_00645 [Chloroflexi bacterium]|nr:hypothetical protein [Chloroflexota bacterium]
MKKDGWLMALGVASPLLYVIVARFFGVVGFPLDDAWIRRGQHLPCGHFCWQ